MARIPNFEDIPDYSEPWCNNDLPVEPEKIEVNADIHDEDD